MNDLRKIYKEEVVQKLKEKLGVRNIMQVPKLQKIVVSMGVKEALTDKKNLERGISVLSLITGQKPKVTRAKKSIASFKLREGDAIGLMVTLRGKMMYNFFEKLVKITLPRVRDFRGVRKTSFDGKGNYNLGFKENTVFPEIDPGKIEKVQGLEVTIVTSTKNDTHAQVFLQELGMPFEKR